MSAGDAGCEPPRLGPLETQVMDLLWDEGASTIRGVIDRLPGVVACDCNMILSRIKDIKGLRL